jgi:hypothetical protein
LGHVCKHIESYVNDNAGGGIWDVLDETNLSGFDMLNRRQVGFILA